MVAGCYGSNAPTYNPGDTSTLVQDITLRGITITATVAGDSACSDPGLINNALHLYVTDPGSGRPRDVFIYTFNPKKWDASKPQVDACQQTYAQANPSAEIVRLDIPVYRVLGADWSSQLKAGIASAVTDASQSGEPGAQNPQ